MANVYGNPAQGYQAPPGAKVDKYGYIEGTQAYNDMNAARAANPNLLELPYNGAPVQGGQYIPQGQTTPVPTGDKPVGQTPTLPQGTTPGSQPEVGLQGGMQQYTTKQGDTLSQIAQKYGVPVSAISGYKSGDPNKIGVGENLSIKSDGVSKAFSQLQGKEAPQDAASALGAIEDNMPGEDAPSIADDLFGTDPYFQELQKMQQDFFSPQNQRKSLAEEYKSMLKESGIEALDMELLNMKNVIEGTEDDIRNEVTKAAGFATDSQVLALTNARNKQLIKNYNTLLETRNAKSSYLDKMMDLTVQDRAEADRRFDAMMDINFKMMDYRDKMKANAVNSYNRIAETAGYDGLMQMAQASGDPRAISRIERTLGMSPGGLKQLAALAAADKKKAAIKEDLQIQLLQSQLKTDDAQRAQIYANTAKIRAESNPQAYDGFLDDKEVARIDSSPQGKKVKALGDLKQKVNNYKALVQKYGTETPLGGQKSTLDASYADLKIAYKEAANLGALTGPDVELLEQAIKPATSGGFFAPVKRFAKNIFGGGKGSIIQGLDETLNIVNQNATNNLNQLYARNPKYSSSWYVQELANPFNDVMQLDDAQIQEMMSDLSPEQQQELQTMGLLP